MSSAQGNIDERASKPPDLDVSGKPSGFVPLSQAGAVPRRAELQRNVDAAEARGQLKQDPAAYAGEALANAPMNAVTTVGGALTLLKNAMGAMTEAPRGMAGLSTPNVDAIRAALPMVVRHFAEYLHPEDYALMLRDNPVGTAADIIGAADGGVRGAGAVTRVAPAVAGKAVAVATSPAVRTVANAAMDAAPFIGKAREAALLRKVLESGKTKATTAAPGLPTSQVGRVAPPSARITPSAVPVAVAPGPGVPTSQMPRVAPPTARAAAPAAARHASPPVVEAAPVVPAGMRSPSVDPQPVPSVPQTRPATPSAHPPSALSPQRIQNDLGLTARRTGAKLSEEEYQAAGELVAQGKSPAEAIARTIGERSAAPIKFRMNQDEATVYARLRKAGKDHAGAVEAIEQQRALAKSLGTPSPRDARKQIAKRQYKN